MLINHKTTAVIIIAYLLLIFGIIFLTSSCTAYKNTTCGKVHDTNQFIGYK